MMPTGRALPGMQKALGSSPSPSETEGASAHLSPSTGSGEPGV